MRVVLARAISVVLAGALLAGAPQPAAAVACPVVGGQCITGVPVSITWSGSATQGGAEVRTKVSSLVTWYSPTTYWPTLGTSTMCRTGSGCSANNDLIGLGSMRIAIQSAACGSSDGTCATACTVSSAFGGNALTGFASANPAAPGAGIAPPTVGTRFSSSLCSTSATVRMANFYIGVTVPAAKNSGTYTSAFVFGIE